MNFTKGEWKAEDNLGCKDILVNGESIACTDGLYDDAEDLANARLIAAAPAMYEALYALSDAIALHNVTVAPEIEQLMNKALAKAEGKE